ncbi:MAG: D-2-hydroxyacid dehydrogenase family protein, partial [Streptosporangiaceae bacterium]
MSVTRIAVLDDYQRRAAGYADWGALGPDAEVVFFAEPIPSAALPATLADFDILVLMRERTAFPRAVLEALPRLKLLVTTGMRNASVDTACLSERGVLYCGTGGGSAAGRPGIPGTAEIAWALILATTKRVTIE